MTKTQTWRATNSDDDGGYIVAVVGNWMVVSDHDVEDEDAEADARLIAAAPDLLAACREMLDATTDGATLDDFILARTYAIAAITIATGKIMI